MYAGLPSADKLLNTAHIIRTLTIYAFGMAHELVQRYAPGP